MKKKRFVSASPCCFGVATQFSAHAEGPLSMASRLDTIVAAKKLTVCTTGDYKPYTYLNPDNGAFEGIDIDLAKDLGKSLGAEVEFVKTSWPTLMKDYTSGVCDIAVGGISVTLDRARQAYYSAPPPARARPRSPAVKMSTSSRPWSRSTSPGHRGE